SHCSFVADVTHEGSRIDSFDRNDLPSFQVISQTFLGAPVRGYTAGLAHHETFNPRARRLRILLINSVVADQRISHADNLTGIRRVCEHFLIASHGSVEDHFSTHFTCCSPRTTTKGPAVFEG